MRGHVKRLSHPLEVPVGYVLSQPLRGWTWPNRRPSLSAGHSATGPPDRPTVVSVGRGRGPKAVNPTNAGIAILGLLGPCQHARPGPSEPMVKTPPCIVPGRPSDGDST